MDFYFFLKSREDLPTSRITKFTRGSSVFHNTMRNNKVEFNP